MEETQDNYQTKVFSDLTEFNAAVDSAKVEGVESLTVTPKLFKIICTDKNSKYVVYRGIRTFIEGTQDEIERVEAMNSEEHHTYITREKLKK